jgi:hypothetical protein
MVDVWVDGFGSDRRTVKKCRKRQGKSGRVCLENGRTAAEE